MQPSGAFIDANLLVLVVIGSVDRDLISKHRRTRRFTPEDYDRLLTMIQEVEQVFVTPNTLTETSNLLGTKDSRFLEYLRFLIEKSKEVIVSSTAAARNKAFPRLGLTDAALLEVISAERPLITVDLELFSAALEKGEAAAINFTHYQALS